MKIIEEAGLQGLDKALSTSLQNGFEMENVMGVVERTESKPGLLTSMLGGATNDVFLETNTIKYDELSETLQLPTGKQFHEYGVDLQKDKPRQMIYEVGSFGQRYNVAPKDYANKRIPGTEELMSEEYVIAQMVKKAAKSWDLFTELAFAELLTTDTNITRGGPMPAYNFYTDIYGGARPAAVSMNLAGAVDHFALFGDQFDILQEEVEKANSSMTSAVILCGKDFYNQRLEIEKQEGLAREIKGPLDLASMDIPRDNFGSGSGKFSYQYFDSHDGFRYIRYSASILGSKIIADTAAYVVPVGSENLFKRIYAPAQDRENVNKTAQSRYVWTKTTSRTGIHTAEESNVLYMNINPKLIRHLTV